MGLSISWIGVQGASKADVLAVLGFVDRGEACDRLNARLAVAFSETVMYSEALALKDGEVLWRVLHYLEDYDEELVIEGEPPPELPAIVQAIEAVAQGDRSKARNRVEV